MSIIHWRIIEVEHDSLQVIVVQLCSNIFNEPVQITFMYVYII